MTFDVHDLDLFLLVGAAVTLGAILAVRVSARSGLPTLLVYLLIGVLLGELPAVGVNMTDAQLAHALGFAALAVILAEGGLTTDWKEMRPSMALGVSLATVGVVVSVTVVAVATHYLLGLPWQLAILLGAICSPTDAAAVFSVLRVVPLQQDHDEDAGLGGRADVRAGEVDDQAGPLVPRGGVEAGVGQRLEVQRGGLALGRQADGVEVEHVVEALGEGQRAHEGVVEGRGGGRAGHDDAGQVRQGDGG